MTMFLLYSENAESIKIPFIKYKSGSRNINMINKYHKYYIKISSFLLRKNIGHVETLKPLKNTVKRNNFAF